MTALLAIDCSTGRVRRYATRRLQGRPLVTDEVSIVKPQCHTIVEQLESLLLQKPMEFAERKIPQDHLPPAAA